MLRKAGKGQEGAEGHIYLSSLQCTCCGLPHLAPGISSWPPGLQWHRGSGPRPQDLIPALPLMFHLPNLYWHQLSVPGVQRRVQHSALQSVLAEALGTMQWKCYAVQAAPPIRTLEVIAPQSRCGQVAGAAKTLGLECQSCTGLRMPWSGSLGNIICCKLLHAFRYQRQNLQYQCPLDFD